MTLGAATVMSPEEREIRQRYKDDYRYFAERCLRVRSKAGDLVPFRFNSVQDFVHARLEEQRESTGKVRALVLKARQEGLSTYIGGRFYHRATHQRGCSVFILTHEQDATNQLFSIVDRFHKHNRGPLKPLTGAANAKELYFSGLDSGYSVSTAGTKATGRSKTIQLFHGSEVAFWPNASEHFAGALQTVPDMPGTEIVLESTANGIGGEYHERWQQAEAGDGDYQAIFCPWFWSTEYQRVPPLGFVLNDEEAEYAGLHGLNLQQMCWRRAKLAELKDLKLFQTEYPATAADAFQTTGHDAFIPSLLVLQARKRTCEGIGSLVVGVDPARYGDDAFCVAWRRGRKLEKVERRYKLDTIQGANWIRKIIDDDKPAQVFVDLGNTGAGVVDLLRDWGGDYERLTEGVNFGAAPMDPVTYTGKGDPVPGPRNRRAEMWMRLKEWLQDEGGADLPDDDALHADLVAPGYKYDARQFLLLESKDDIRKRGLRSPDGGDAAALTLARPVKATDETAASAGRWRRSQGRGKGLSSLWGR
jgi:hypothetical protein